MKYTLKNGKTVVIRQSMSDDAQAIINVILTADTESNFLARNPGEFNITLEQEKDFIANINNDDSRELFIAEYEGKVIGISSVGLVSKYERYRHRAEVTFVLLKDYCGIGIGGKLMQHCIDWCESKNIRQIELNVVADNIRAIKMYEEFGFKTIGIIPNSMSYTDGTFADEKIMILEM